MDETRIQQVMMSNQTPKKQWTSECFDESRIPEAIKILRLSRQKNLRENRIAELTKKFQYGKYAMSRLTDNIIFERARNYLSCFYINDFKEYKSKSKISEEIWFRNEGLPTGEGLYELYIWFCGERGYSTEKIKEDLVSLGELIRKEKVNVIRKENEWRRKERELVK